MLRRKEREKGYTLIKSEQLQNHHRYHEDDKQGSLERNNDQIPHKHHVTKF